MRKCSGSHSFAVSLSLGMAVAMGFCCAVSGAQQPAAPAPAPTAKPAPAPAPGGARDKAPGQVPRATRIGPVLSPEKLDRALELEARTVARQLKLDDEKTSKLVDAYKATRRSYQQEMEKILSESGAARQNVGAMREAAENKRKELQTALQGFLTEEQANQAVATLGTFSRRWDQMVIALDEMELSDNVENRAMELVADYAKDSGAAVRAAATPQDRQALREKAQQRREQLDSELAKILTPDQLAKWKEAVGMRRARQ